MKFIGWECGFGGDIEDTNSDKIYKCQKWTVQKSDISMKITRWDINLYPEKVVYYGDLYNTILHLWISWRKVGWWMLILDDTL